MKDELIWKLAQRLHSKMEHLDPTDAGEWTDLSDRHKEFYRLCVVDQLEEIKDQGLVIVPVERAMPASAANFTERAQQLSMWAAMIAAEGK